MKLVVAALLLSMVVGLGQSWAVTAGAGAGNLPVLDEVGDKVYTSAKNRWVPYLVFLGFVAAAIVCIVGMMAVSRFIVRVIFACILLAIGCSGVASALIPGLITGLTL